MGERFGEDARSGSEPQISAAQTHPQYFKAGTIERIYDDCGAADGRGLALHHERA